MFRSALKATGVLDGVCECLGVPLKPDWNQVDE